MSNLIYIVIFLFLMYNQAQSQVRLPNKLLNGQAIIIDHDLNVDVSIKVKF